MHGRTAALAALACAASALVAAGCGAEAGDDVPGPLTVYVSSPLRGPAAPHGQDIRDGASLALEQADGKAGEVEIASRFLDATAGSGKSARWTPAAVAANARAAAQDTSAIAYIGDFESGATRISLPITNQAMLPQVSAASTALDLVTDPEAASGLPAELQPSGERTFLRVIPDDRVQAEAAAAWARQLGVRRAVTLSDGTAFGDAIVEEFAEAASGLGIEVVESQGQGDFPTDSELVYVGGEGEGAAVRLAFAAAALPEALLMSSDALLPDAVRMSSDLPPPGPSPAPSPAELDQRLHLTAAAQDPRQLPPSGQEFVSDFKQQYGRAPGPYAAYGYEAMALVLDAIERAGAQAEDRRAVLDELLATSDRDSVLGTYSITPVGDTTLETVAGYRVEQGRASFDRVLKSP